ncbi:GNAT family N-acetyltransferase [Nonomuraea sp. SYSU D8015]|uniref:GNAT family N-acetyltransferase n=1 Tax=Nonomuraea sp. SYSU D8015 TaxID=2593644 RepID=UPI001CB6D01C|nr:GNAT family N-acetyltransferase [Nonomuraea sp. SYSU D8015]
MDRARRLWADLARVPVVFPERGEASVVASPGSWMCPPGWAGIVALDGALLATVPEPGMVEPLRGALLRHLDLDLARLARRLPVREVLGPAALAYLDDDDFVAAHGEVEILPAGHPDVLALIASVDERDAAECGLEEVDSPVFVLREGREVIAASGHRTWLDTAAHLSVLTASGHRGRGLARMVASAAVAHALGKGLLPQWRARPEASRRVARALGFQEYGEQISVHLTT